MGLVWRLAMFARLQACLAILMSSDGAPATSWSFVIGVELVHPVSTRKHLLYAVCSCLPPCCVAGCMKQVCVVLVYVFAQIFQLIDAAQSLYRNFIFYILLHSLFSYLFVPFLFFLPLTSCNLLDLRQLPLGYDISCSFSNPPPLWAIAFGV